MTRLDIKGDAERTFEVMQRGGIAIFPVDVGYSIMGGSAQALKTIFGTKQRGGHKRNGLIADMVTQREIHMLDQDKQDMIEMITQDYGLPLGPIAPYNPDHPMIKNTDPELLHSSSAGGTLSMLVNAGPFHAEICKLSREAKLPTFGSSANLTGTGTKFRLEDVQPELRAIADIEIDYGLRKYHFYRRSSTMINFETMQVVRIGACYDLICDILKRHYDIDLPPDPGFEASPGGHTNEFALPVI